MNDVQALSVFGITSLLGQTEASLKKKFRAEIKKAHDDNKAFGHSSKYTASEVKEAYTILLEALKQGNSLNYTSTMSGFGGFRQTRQTKVISFDEFKSMARKELLKLSEEYILIIEMRVTWTLERDGKAVKEVNTTYRQHFNVDSNIFYFDIDMDISRSKDYKINIELDEELRLNNLELDFREIVVKLFSKCKLVTYYFVFKIKTKALE